MGVKYLLDTNILSELSRDTPNPNVIESMKLKADHSVTASVVMHEVKYGIARLADGRQKQNLRLFLQQLEACNFQVLSYDASAADYHAQERARLTAKGLTPAFADGQIAAIAASNNLVLVTRNTDDFVNFKGLSLENWFERYC